MKLVELSATNDGEIQSSFGKMLQSRSRFADRILSLAFGCRVSDGLEFLADVVPIVRAAVRDCALLECFCHASYAILVVATHGHEVVKFRKPKTSICPVTSDLYWLGRWHACQCFGKGHGKLLSVLRHASVPQRDDMLHQSFH